MENWQDVLYLTARSEASSTITSIYLISWIFIGNYIFLNLFLAILLDGFDSSGALQTFDEVENEMAEIENIYKAKNLELEEKRNVAEKLEKAEKNKLSKIINPEDVKTEADIKREKLMFIINNNQMPSSSSSDSDDNDYFQYYLNKKMKIKKVKKDLYKDVYCEKTFFYIPKKNPVRKLCAWISSHEYFETIILTLIILGSLKLVVETYIDTDQVNMTTIILSRMDLGFNILFTIEMFVKVMRNGFIIDEGSYLRESWHMLDFFIVCSSWVDIAVEGIDLPFIKVLRLFRTLRPLRFISHNKSMKIVVNALM